MKYLSLLSLIFVSLSAQAEVCPLGPKEDHLILARVMRNFSKYTRDADSLAVKSKQWPEDITDTELKEASEKIPTAIACADAALDNPQSEMLPRKLDELQGEMREKYLAHYLEYLKKFRAVLVQYKQVLDDLLALPKAQRQFEGLYLHYKFVDDMTNEAHSHLGGG